MALGWEDVMMDRGIHLGDLVPSLEGFNLVASDLREDHKHQLHVLWRSGLI